MSIEFGYWAPNLGTSFVATTIVNRTRADFQGNKDYAQQAEKAGFKYALFATRFVSSLEGNEGTYDSLTIAAGVAAVTDTLVPVVAVATGLAHPAIVAKQMITLDEISQGRAAINIVSGWLKDEYTSLGQNWLEHDERYKRSKEFIDILRLLWSSQTSVSYNGHFYRLNQVDFRPKPLTSAGIPIFQGGNSTAARQMAAQTCDFYFLNGASVDSLQQHIQDVSAQADTFGRKLKFAVNAFVIVRETEEEAIAVLKDIIANADVEVVERFQKNVRQAGKSTQDGKGMWAESKFEDLIQFNDGFKTGLIGTKEQVAERILALKTVGIDMVLAGFLHYEEELAAFGEVINRVRELELES
jgi:FMNH2-dependent dimethyl sulfone monooxygenase